MWIRHRDLASLVKPSQFPCLVLSETDTPWIEASNAESG